MAEKLPVWTALVLVIGTGIVDSLWTNRWAASKELQAAVARLEGLPLMLGDWEGQTQALDARQLEIGEIAGHASCRYVNRRTGESVSVLVVCGRPGPISVHSPEVCYSGAGYELVGDPIRQFIADGGSAPAEFWLANFQKPSPAAMTPPLRMFWAWSANGAWQAPENPRFSFAQNSCLYKIYVTRSIESYSDALKDDPGLELLRLLLPRLQQTLFTAS